MSTDQLKDVLDEIAPWSLEELRAFIANLAIHSTEDAEQVKAGLLAIWEHRKR
ncbi:hypothetical protein [Paraburkholderia antibiotica]|uniref:Uncharacterized protein n=1 Tax=Paraburkholderia antibiotica TaxID=2728839 RepID=A0A7Y0A1R3_9BURK|nr:hypothetical protein [Paraburkholderia antibiotica]NML34917.1 hypothetical protein [Paraburkholderia antibiotica]